MLTNEEHQAMIMFDRLLMLAKDNDTLVDLLDQTLNVARMIDPRPEDKITYGPLQRMHFEWQQMKYRMSEIEKKMEQYIASQNRYGAGNWPSNPGMVGYPQTSTSGTGSIGSYGTLGDYGFSAVSTADINSMMSKSSIQARQHQIEIDNQMENLKEQLLNISNNVLPPQEAK